MLRIRFHSNEDDPRPIKWPIKYPYWISGYGPDYAILVAYADSQDYILENWPEATDIDITEVDSIMFTERFSKPDWYKEA